jgi:hypothetical protein
LTPFAVAAVSAALHLAVAAAPAAPAAPSVSTPEQRERYLLAREKCARCHGFARAVSSRLTVASWKRHLKKMAVRPNTAISDEQAQAILEFLKSYASSRK